MSTDNFNRASIGANWTAATGADAFDIVSSIEARCSATGDPTISYYNPDTPAADQFVEWTVGATRETAADCGSGGAVRIQTGASSCYFGITNTNASGEIQAGKCVADSWTILASYTAGTAPAVDALMRVEITGTGAGSSLKVSHAGTLRITHNADTSFSSGRYGMAGIANAVRSTIDDWQGDVVTSATKAPSYRMTPQFYRAARRILCLASIAFPTLARSLTRALTSIFSKRYLRTTNQSDLQVGF